MKKFLDKALNKTEQKNIKGKLGLSCNTYNGPIFVTCEQYEALPPEHKGCVKVSVDCFPR